MKGWKLNRSRRHMLFVPADKPAMYRDVVFYKPDTIMFDLEDAVSFSEKDSTRILLREILSDMDYNKYGMEVCVRVNGIDTDWFEKDVEACVQSNVNMIRLPKVEKVEDIEYAVKVLEKFEAQYKREDKMLLFLAFESALGILNSFEIAKASERIVGVALGGFDYILDLKGEKTEQRTELLYARQHLVHVARALKLDVFDVVYSNVNDKEGFVKEFKFVKSLGFNGKSVIHPNQIRFINEIYKPTPEQVEYALEMVRAFNKSVQEGVGVFQFRGTMVDKPVVEKQMEILEIAKQFELVKEGDY
ncbi:citrate lyase subunit beta / citryl-CoA lyase [Spiroplasma helicoides]|uniref:Citrate lyase subunit beta / citryl-CoA lyase n=1 Tax=Spiroplasma helicoides TaxID=216938 RepID=A0A1B3SM20_9MOLU|nr:aldolase/citrate lyase family protein [Spiroplasma helicoides]AOG60986.1 citrate lyase subunit beta / citryl-CoA lyase [Spiroplasma helicoides]